MKRTQTPCSARSGSSRSIVSAKISISASTSSSERDQFSVEKAKTARSWMPRSIDASTMRRTVRAPARWPAAVGSRRLRAQRPFPSRMMATDCATSGSAGSAAGRTRESVRRRVRKPMEVLDLHDLGFFALQEVVDARDMLVGELLHPRLRGALLVVAGAPVLDQLLEVPDGVAADVA